MAATNGAGADPVHEPPHKITKMAPLLKVKKLSDKAILPSRGSALAAGYDLSSAVETVVPARGKALVATDLSIAIPEGTYARIAPRSGLALKHSIDVGAGVIDADYRGPVGVVLFNHSEVDFAVKPGDRVAQMIIQVITTPEIAEVEDLDATVRGEGGPSECGMLEKLHPHTWATDLLDARLVPKKDAAIGITVMWAIWSSRNRFTHHEERYRPKRSMEVISEIVGTLEFPPTTYTCC
ncbi:unnamed protein product [Triticum turgidum subsp. durum]|uniref:Deoxyuridine 5'-triphosphate nucleotidohydrolase n=1 Tax=Triticum turgidum subsp. durum TaxID=4567 RepID=A0A9R0SIC3_TRITD|nr:unnamed protein product [Triticum turgidum subsp. durum]